MPIATCANYIYRCQKIAPGSPSGALDSRQNVRFPPVECSVVSARSNSNGPIRVESEPPCERPLPPARHKPLRKAEEVNFKSKFSFFTSLSAAEAHVFGVKFIGLYGTVVLLRFGTFPFEEKAICGVTSGQRWMEWSAFPFF